MTQSVLLALFLLCIGMSKSQTLWLFDPTAWRATPNAKPTAGLISSVEGQITYSSCQSQCNSAAISCLSFTWDGDIDVSTSTGSCHLYSSRFGFQSGGLETDKIGEGDIVLLEYKGSVTYFEKPIDNEVNDDVGHHLILNALRLNSKSYDDYLAQTNLIFNYHQFLMYYRAGIPGYVNNSAAIFEGEANNKYSVIIEYEAVMTAEECAKYCTRNRGAIDVELGTRCISFNYNTDGRCHLLTFSLDGGEYNIEQLPKTPDTDRKDTSAGSVNSGWYYYEGLVGAGCWIVQSQCRKWEDGWYVAQQEAIGNSLTVGEHIGVIRKDANDEVCSKCSNSMDYTKEYEYICLNYAREYHEDICDNYADEATAVFWGQDGAKAVEIWNSWDLSEGCVIDLTAFNCTVNLTKYDPPNPNTRFAGRKFRDSIGEEEFAAAVVKKACWNRAKEWYDYCGLGGQSTDGKTVYLNVSYPSDGSFYLEPAIPCECDEYGMKIESGFGLGRYYCTRDSTEPFCWREKQENYWAELDVLCDDLTEPNVCSSTDTNPQSHAGTGCYLFYPQPESTSRVALSYHCEEGGDYGFDSESFTTVNNVIYREIMCQEVPAGIDPCNSGEPWTATDCKNVAETIHNSCGNNLEDLDEQIIVWWRPEGQVMTFPNYSAPYETTWVRGFSPAGFYTENPDKVRIDFMPIRNGRWQTFKPEESGNLRQTDVYYYNTINANLTMTIWSGHGITESVFLNQESIIVPVDDTIGYIQGFIRFPLDNITLTAGDVYTWQVTSVTDNPNQLGELGYVRGNGYMNGIGDMAWDYLFVTWVEGTLHDNQGMIELPTISIPKRPWFEIWCVMIIILFIIFLVFLCLLHWKRKYDEDRERKEDKKFQAELRQRAMIQAEAERNAKNGIEEESDEYDSKEADGVSDYDEEEEHGNDRRRGTDDDDDGDDDNYENEPDDDHNTKKTKKKSGDHLGAPGGGSSDYKRVKSASKNDIPDDGAGDGGYIEDERPKKKKKKKKKPKKRKSDDYEYDDDF